MFYIMQLLQRFETDEKGQAMAEYGIILALVAAVVIAVLALLGQDILGSFNTIRGELNTP